MAPCNRSFDSLTSDEKTVITEKMRPGKMSQLGYLGDDDDIDDVVSRDIKTVRDRGLTAKDITESLKTVIGRHDRHQELYPKSGSTSCDDDIYLLLRESMHSRVMSDESSRQWCLWISYCSPVTFNGIEFKIMSMTWGGAALCPFQSEDDDTYHGYKYGSRDFCIYNPVTEIKIMFNDLNLHMAEQHDFWEGSTIYRLDPVKAIECLMLRPDILFRGPTVTENIWSLSMSQSGQTDVDYTDCIKRWASAENTEVISNGGIIGFFSKKMIPWEPKKEMLDMGERELRFHCWIPSEAKNTSIAGAELNTSYVTPNYLSSLIKKKHTYYLLESEVKSEAR